ncbi:MAG: helix-turn-helix transcriptional regulator [Clostridia bacterium]|nr:helix-turn-helix transcriptional regulator [Clostridia bacterium]
MSTRQISRIIEQEYGCSFSQLVMNKRLDHCRMLLENTEMPFYQIAQQVFSDTPNYFYATFKRRFGITPAKYRKEARVREKQENH